MGGFLTASRVCSRFLIPCKERRKTGLSRSEYSCSTRRVWRRERAKGESKRMHAEGKGKVRSSCLGDICTYSTSPESVKTQSPPIAMILILNATLVLVSSQPCPTPTAMRTFSTFHKSNLANESSTSSRIPQHASAPASVPEQSHRLSDIVSLDGSTV